ELTVIAGDDGGTLAKVRIDHRLHAGFALDVGELRGRVAVAGSVGFLVRNGDPRLRSDRHALGAHGFAEGTPAPAPPEGGEIPPLEVGENLLEGHRVGMRRLESPFADRLDDLNGASQ